METIIFDFDGTIADDFGFVQRIFADLAPKYGRPAETSAEIENQRDLPLSAIVKHFNLSKLDLIRITLDARREMAEFLPTVKCPEGLPEVLKQFRDKGYQLAIISSNDKKAIKDFLKTNKIEEFFPYIDTSVDLFGKSKKITKLMKKLGSSKSETIYIGDEVRDYEAAKEAGIAGISVTWGYNTAEVLEKNNDLIAKKPSDLPALVTSLFK